MPTSSQSSGISSFKTTQVMIAGNFEVYHYREPYFKSLDFHTHDFYETYLFLDGSVTYYIEDQACELCAGDLLIIPPGRMHRPVISNSAAVYERIVLWLNTDYLFRLDGGRCLEALSRISREKGYLVSLNSENLAFSLQLLNRLIRSADDFAQSGAYCQSLIIAFLYTALDAFSSQTAPSHQPEGQDLIPDVLRYINEHFTDPLTLDDLCTEFFLSKFYLIRKFKEYTNATIYDYIISKRIGLARKLIRQGMSAAEACERCGFSDYSNFYKAFTAKTGMTPAQFKKCRGELP